MTAPTIHFARWQSVLYVTAEGDCKYMHKIPSCIKITAQDVSISIKVLQEILTIYQDKTKVFCCKRCITKTHVAMFSTMNNQLSHFKDRFVILKNCQSYSLLASEVNPAMVSTVRFYDRNELYGSSDFKNCRMPNFIGWAFFVISLISIN